MTTPSMIEITAMTASDIEVAVGEWHEAGTQLQVHEYAGLTFEEYARWVKDDSAVPAARIAAQIPRARAAIEAMMTPTPEMEKVGALFGLGEHHAAKVWRAMLDVALAAIS